MASDAPIHVTAGDLASTHIESVAACPVTLLFVATSTPSHTAATVHSPNSVSGTSLVDLPVLSSANAPGHVLDLLMIAAPMPNPVLQIPGKNPPTIWGLIICPRPADGSWTSCPAGTATAYPYGGTRLQLYPGQFRIEMLSSSFSFTHEIIVLSSSALLTSSL